LDKGIIYYTNNDLNRNIFKIVQEYILKARLQITSCSLKPIDFGENIVLKLKPSVITMFKQILVCLEKSTADIVFFCEHDVLYHKSHFNFEPKKDNTYYYNTNVWRWRYPGKIAITYDNLISLSGLCANRKLLINHYYNRFEKIKEMGWEDGRDPNWARKIGYEPGKKKRRGGFIDEPVRLWKSKHPNIDIRHKDCLTPPKTNIKSFRHQPTGWKEINIEKITDWNLRKI